MAGKLQTLTDKYSGYDDGNDQRESVRRDMAVMTVAGVVTEEVSAVENGDDKWSVAVCKAATSASNFR